METKISKRLIKKAEKITGDDTGAIDSLETLIDSVKMSVYFDWVDRLCKDRINTTDLHQIMFEYGLSGCEYNLEKVIIFLSNNNTANIESAESYLKSNKNW